MVLESPEALNVIKEGHIQSIISLLDKHGRNHKVMHEYITGGLGAERGETWQGKSNYQIVNCLSIALFC